MQFRDIEGHIKIPPLLALKGTFFPVFFIVPFVETLIFHKETFSHILLTPLNLNHHAALFYST